MKNLFVILSFGILLASCSKTENKEININVTKSDSLEASKEFVVDSIRVQDSVSVNKNLTVLFNKQLLIFPSVKNKTILDSIYKNAMIEAGVYDTNSLKSVLTKNMQKSFDDAKKNSKEWSPDFKQTWDDTSGMKMISNQNNVLTLQYSGSGYTGGAHGYYFENYKAFDLKNNKVISQNDIFQNPNDKSWNDILMKNFTNKDQKQMLLVDKIELNDNFYFDQNQITFIYNQYEIAAYAAGVVHITIPFSSIKDKLKPEFIKMYNIQ